MVARDLRAATAGLPRRAREVVPLVAARFSEHRLLTHASAIAFRGLISLVPLVLLGLALLGALGAQDVWRDTLAPPIEQRMTRPVYDGINSSVEKILSSGTAGLIAFAALLLLWDLTWGVTAVMEALNGIHEVEERRPFWRRALVAAALAVATAICIVGSALIVTFLGRVHLGGVATALLAVAKWASAIALLGLAVGLLVHYAPAERPQVRWASAGSILVVASWIVASLVFRWWVTSVANFRSAAGQLTVFLLLTLYVFVSAVIFLVGVDLDELLRSEKDE